jgi:ankyrin repeat protein
MSNYETIFHAAKQGSVQDVGYFLEEKNIDVNIIEKSGDGFTPLHWASTNANIEVVEFLVSKGANVNAKDNQWLTPLHWAALIGLRSIEIARFLVSKGADVNAKCNDGMTPLHCAVVNTLNNEAVHNNMEEVTRSKIEIVKILVSKGADINANSRVDAGYTPLHMVIIEGGNFEVARFLVSIGANVNATGIEDDDVTPLTVVLDMGVPFSSFEYVKALITAGADINTKDRAGCTLPELIAVNYFEAVQKQRSETIKTKYVELLKFLISAGANANMRIEDDFTLLHCAVFAGDGEFSKFLVSNGADFTAKDRNDLTPLGFAKKEGKTEVVQYLSRLSQAEYERLPPSPALNNSKEPITIGATIAFGNYKWRILDVQGGRALILTEDIIEKRRYNEKDEFVTWKTCTLRKYLNGEFLQKFTSEATRSNHRNKNP